MDLLSVIVGGAIGIIGALGVQFVQYGNQRGAARGAARGYVSGVLKMEVMRRHPDLYRAVVEDWKRGQQTPMPVIFGAEEPFPDPLLASVADQVALLDDEAAADLVALVNVKVGLDIDLRAIARGAFSQLPLADRINIVEQDLALWDKWLKQGDELLDRLETKRAWWRRFF